MCARVDDDPILAKVDARAHQLHVARHCEIMLVSNAWNKTVTHLRASSHSSECVPRVITAMRRDAEGDVACASERGDVTWLKAGN